MKVKLAWAACGFCAFGVVDRLVSGEPWWAIFFIAASSGWAIVAQELKRVQRP